MNHSYWLNCSTVLLFLLVSTKCIAISWQDKLTNLSDEQIHHNIVAGTQSGGLSLSSLSTLLEGGSSALSANTMANAAGVIEYCTRNKLSSLANAEKIQSKLVQRLKLTHPRNSATKKDYAQGQSGLLNTHNGQQLDMNDLSHSELAAEVKMKACDLVLKQGMDYLSR
ncbi:DUF2501 domain-containing protein [Klebsiella sp. BIGb0407]|uniref:DUF2501 domain-containing protein n=1 Tax=Klebsiella sp. BIGb0407 TaxID=2940603 RepID=UPI002168E9A3|nr:DUF2501 domain-containing protein [Klebsiella sp. BIGb0407]MCS3432954.1 hypothetical protein [Klebsiella sp. BIGb0407]